MASAEAELLLRLNDQTQKGFDAVLNHLKQVERQSKDTEKATSTLGGAFKDFGSGLLGGFGVGLGFMTAQKAGEAFAATLMAIPNAIGASASRVLELGGKMADLSAKTGVGAEALQKFQYAGSQAGVGLDSITGAITKMQKALVDTPEKFERLGLSVAHLRAMKPEDQFVAIAEQIGRIKDPAERAAAAIEVFGKAGAALLPLTGNMRELMAEAERLGFVLGDDVVGAADDLGDSLDTLSQVWEGLTNNIGAAIVTSEPLHVLIRGLTEILGSMSRAVSDNRDEMRGFVDSAVIVLANGLVLLGDAVQAGMTAWTALRLLWQSLVQTGLTLEKGFASLMLWQAKFKGDQGAIDFYTSSLSLLNTKIKDNEKAMADAMATHDKGSTAIANVQKQIAALAKEVEAAAGKTHQATRETKDLTGALGENEKRVKDLAKAEADWNKFRLDVFKRTNDALTKGNKEQQDALDARNKAQLKALEEIGKAEENDAKRRAAQQESAAQVLERNFQAARALAYQFVEMGRDIGGAFGAVLELGGSAVLVLQNLDQKAETTSQKLAAVGQAMNAAMAAYKGGDVFGGAMGGAAAGASFGPWGAAIGAVAGGLLGLFGKAAKARKELEKLRSEVIQQHGGMENLKNAAASVGMSLDRAFSTKSPEEAKRIFEELNKKLEEKEKRLQGIKTAIGGLTLMTQGFAASMERAGAATDRTQAAFSRLGNFAVATFAGLVKETGDLIGALTEMGPALDQLSGMMAEFGFSASGAFARLLQLRDIVTQNEDVAQSISGLAQLMKGLGEAGMITRDLLLDMGAQASANFAELIARGVDANAAMSLMQPTLQELWEQQKRLGVTYDENTQKLLDEAAAHGLVGEQFMSVNEQMLELLKILVETVGGELPSALRRMGNAAESEFNRMGDAANRAGDAAASIGGRHGGGDGRAEESYATGIREVPRTMVARIHTGEEVVPASDRAARRRGGGGPVIMLQAAPIYMDGRKVGQQLQRRIDSGDMRSKNPLRKAG
jgi:hypothetical protein